MVDNFKNIIKLLSEGKVILYPTDTIWGLGCDAHNLDAINTIYQIKNRDKNKPFIILVSDIEMLKNYVKQIHPRIETLLEYHKRPLTIIYPKGKNLPDILMMNGNIAIRIVKDIVIEQLIREFGRPIVSSSANIAGDPSPEIFKNISKKVKSSVDYTFKYKRYNSNPSKSSVIAKYTKKGRLKFLR